MCIPVNRTVSSERIVAKLDKVKSQDPYVIFSETPKGKYLYVVRILVFIPSQVSTFNVEGPGEKKLIKTYMGEVMVRTIRIRWPDTIVPGKEPHDLWSIVVEYGDHHFTEKDDCIRVLYEYGDPKTSRGTVTTSGSGVG